jgi:hypothetical protein
MTFTLTSMNSTKPPFGRKNAAVGSKTERSRTESTYGQDR